MKDSSKTKQALIAENFDLKKRIQELERTASGKKIEKPARAEPEWSESEEQYRAFFNHARDAMLLTKPDGSILDANPAACKMFGRSVKEIRRAGRKGLVDISDPRLQAAFSELVRKSETMTEITMLRANGDKFPAEIASTVFVDATGQEKTGMIIRDMTGKHKAERDCQTLIPDGGYHSSVRDLTDRKQAEEELHKSNARLKKEQEFSQLVFDTSPAFIVAIDFDGKTLMMNQALLAALECTPDQIRGIDYIETFVPAEDRDAVASVFRQLVEEGKVTISQNRIISRSGRIYLVEWHGRNVVSGGWEAGLFVGVGIDITDRKCTEEALQESEKKYRLIAENTADLISILDMNLRFTYVSPASMSLRGFTVEEALAQNLDQVLTPESIRLALTVFEKEMELEASGTADPERTRILELEEYKKDGSVIWVEVSLSFLRNEDRKPVEILIVSRDITEHKRVEEALRRSEANYRQLFDNAPAGIYQIDYRTGKMLKANDLICEYMGCSPEEVTSLNLFDLMSPESQQLFLERMIKINSGEKVTENPEFELITRDGKRRWIQLNIKNFCDSSGTVTGADVVAHEITERKQAEEALRESEEKYRNLFENANEAIFVAKESNLIYFNPMTSVMSGYSSEELTARPFVDFIHPDDRGMVMDRHIGRIKGENIPQRYSYRIIHKDGSIRWAEANAILINWKGKPAVLNFVNDITERTRTEEQLKKSEEKYRDILENIEDGYFEQDLAGNFIFLNTSMSRIYGYSQDELMGMNYKRHTDEENGRKCLQIYRNIYRTGEPGKVVDFEIIRKDGTRRHLESSVSLKKDSADKPIAFRGIVRDITDRKQTEQEKRNLEERLQRAEKMEALGQLAGGVAHDLNNVLGVLTGYSELLMMEIPEGQRARSHVEKILQSTEKGAAIIQDLLTLARRGVTVSEVINLNSVVAGFLQTPVFEMIKDYHPRVIFRTECQERLLNIRGSSVHLEKTLMNLVSNAAESIPGKGEVTIRTENRYIDKAIRGYDEVKEGDYAILAVSDTGMGIPAENKGKIFEPFYTRKKMGKSGTGLGLAIVWGTVKDHNGYIDVQTKVGEGTTFTLYFPVTREALIATQQKEPIERYMGRGESVLVVDDMAEQRDVASGLLRKLGYEVHAVSSGEEAVEYLRGNEADILVLDMIMAPGIDGLETYQRVLEVNPKQKAIIVSGFSETDRVRKAQELGAGVYVKKPYLMEKIGAAIYDELRR